FVRRDLGAADRKGRSAATASLINFSGGSMHLITCPPRLSNTLLTSMVALCALACAAEAEAPNPYALSHEAVSVGQPLELLGHDFVSAKKGWVDVTFSGEFRSFETDEVHPVDFTVELAAED